MSHESLCLGNYKINLSSGFCLCSPVGKKKRNYDIGRGYSKVPCSKCMHIDQTLFFFKLQTDNVHEKRKICELADRVDNDSVDILGN